MLHDEPRASYLSYLDMYGIIRYPALSSPHLGIAAVGGRMDMSGRLSRQSSFFYQLLAKQSKIAVVSIFARAVPSCSPFSSTEVLPSFNMGQRHSQAHIVPPSKLRVRSGTVSGWLMECTREPTTPYV